jgi:catechol 2,3-dioxygenase-like lactoylglutathione lyase family enzyme
MDRACPNLPSRDLRSTAVFYGGFGFTETFRDEGWLVLERGTAQLEFFAAPDVDPFSSGFMCTVRVDDLDALYAAVLATGVPEATVGFPRLHPPRREDWGQRAAYLVDPDGTQLTLIEN